MLRFYRVLPPDLDFVAVVLAEESLSCRPRITAEGFTSCTPLIPTGGGGGGGEESETIKRSWRSEYRGSLNPKLASASSTSALSSVDPFASLAMGRPDDGELPRQRWSAHTQRGRWSSVVILIYCCCFIIWWIVIVNSYMKQIGGRHSHHLIYKYNPYENIIRHTYGHLHTYIHLHTYHMYINIQTLHTPTYKHYIHLHTYIHTYITHIHTLDRRFSSRELWLSRDPQHQIEDPVFLVFLRPFHTSWLNFMYYCASLLCFLAFLRPIHTSCLNFMYNCASLH